MPETTVEPREPVVAAAARRPRHSTRTIMTAAAVGAAVGIVLVPLNFAVTAVTATLPIVAVVVYGVWGMSALIPLALLRRGGAGVIGATAAGLVSSISPYGLVMVVMMLAWGVFMELPFAATRYRRFGRPTFLVAGVVTGALSCVMSIYSLDLLSMAPGTVAAICAVQLVSFVVCSLASLAIAARLGRAGIGGARRQVADE
jgi:energy-coupling factor transport system substrate-specific component